MPSGRGGRKALYMGFMNIGNHYLLTVRLECFSIFRTKSLSVTDNYEIKCSCRQQFSPKTVLLSVTKSRVSKCPCQQKFWSPYVFVTTCTCHQKCVTKCTVTKWLSPYVLEPLYYKKQQELISVFGIKVYIAKKNVNLKVDNNEKNKI